MNKAINPEDVLADDRNTMMMSGTTIRKATFAAMMTNIEILEQANSTPEVKAATLEKIIELAPI